MKRFTVMKVSAKRWAIVKPQSNTVWQTDSTYTAFIANILVNGHWCDYRFSHINEIPSELNFDAQIRDSFFFDLKSKLIRYGLNASNLNLIGNIDYLSSDRMLCLALDSKRYIVISPEKLLIATTLPIQEAKTLNEMVTIRRWDKKNSFIVENLRDYCDNK